MKPWLIAQAIALLCLAGCNCTGDCSQCRTGEYCVDNSTDSFTDVSCMKLPVCADGGTTCQCDACECCQTEMGHDGPVSVCFTSCCGAC